MIEKLRKACKSEVFDYGFLMDQLKNYKAPRRKVNGLLKSGRVIRVKKGLYVFGEDYRRRTIDRVVLANLIFGPSYVSLEYALAYYGLIPERVEVVTSICTKRKKTFETPFGLFTYTYLNPRRFTVGIDWISTNHDQHGLIASPEKALADIIFFQKELKGVDEVLEHLIENLRIDEESLSELNLERLDKIVHSYRSKGVSQLLKAIRSLD
jgi:predicted transcriptional regulator of viral defense system